jgi:hypothetical protein
LVCYKYAMCIGFPSGTRIAGSIEWPGHGLDSPGFKSW